MLGDSNFIFKTYIVIAAAPIAPIAPKTRINKIIPINEIIIVPNEGINVLRLFTLCK